MRPRGSPPRVMSKKVMGLGGVGVVIFGDFGLFLSWKRLFSGESVRCRCVSEVTEVCWRVRCIEDD